MFFRRWKNTLLSIVFTALLASTIEAGVRVRGLSQSPNIDPNSHSRLAQFFNPGGIFEITGGVILDGKVEFFHEHNGEATPLDTSELYLSVDERGRPQLSINKPWYMKIFSEVDSFALEMHQGVACPLSQFFERGGRIVFTLPPDNNPTMLDEEGIEMFRITLQNRNTTFGVAKEFEDDRLLPLLFHTDFAEVVPLAKEDMKDLISAIETEMFLSSRRRQLDNSSSYLNTDTQIIYRSYLIQTSKRVETEGVPLRYQWNQSPVDGAIRITEISQLSLEGVTEQSQPTNFLTENKGPTQADVAIFFQTAAIFRTLYQENASWFSDFRSQVCQ